jgi:hypothetical protein
LRIVDAITRASGAIAFATAAAEISPVFNREIYEKIADVSSFQKRLEQAEHVFTECREKAESKKAAAALAARMRSLDKRGRLIFFLLL